MSSSSHVGYKSDKTSNLTTTQHAIAGACSGFLVRSLLQPLDVVKIRFQVTWRLIYVSLH